MRPLQNVLQYAGILCLLLAGLASCKNDHGKDAKDDSAIIYSQRVFDSLQQFRQPQSDTSEKKINQDLQGTISPRDRVAALLIKRAYRYNERNTNSISVYLAQIDSILKSNNIDLTKTPYLFVEYQVALAEYNIDQGNFDIAKKTLAHLAEYSYAHDSISKSYIYNALASYYFFHDELEQARYYSEQSFLARKHKSGVDSLDFNYNMMFLILRIYNSDGKIASNKPVIDSLNSILETSKRIYERAIPRNEINSQNLVESEVMMDFLNGRQDDAIALSVSNYEHLKQEHKEKAEHALNVGITLENANKPSQAGKYYQEGITLAQKEKDNLKLLTGYKYYSDVLQQLGNFKEANQYLLLERDISQVIYNEQKEKAIATIERDSKLKLKTQENVALAMENELKSKTLNNRTTLFIVIALTLLLAMFFVILLFRQRILRKQLEKSKVEQQLFRLQMNPHFLFNAIAGIRGNVLNDEKEQAVNYLSMFSKLLRTQLEHNNQEWISIADEVAFIENYLALQQLRYADKFSFSIIIDPALEAETVLIPSMILQPFVENCIEHGFFNIDYKGQIDITIHARKENAVSITIKDNGVGLRLAKSKNVADIIKQKSLALEIVKRRLKIITLDTGINSSLELIEDKGTVATLIVATKIL